jgi:predicted nucleotidyltransferase
VTDDVLTMEGLRRRRTEILGVARKRRAHRVAVFGSVARGEARPGSDLDLLVDFEPGASLLDHVGLFQDLEELLGVGVDVVTRSALKPRDDHIRARGRGSVTRGVDDLLADLAEAADAAAELVSLGKKR